jgi:hypothetical protein
MTAKDTKQQRGTSMLHPSKKAILKNTLKKQRLNDIYSNRNLKIRYDRTAKAQLSSLSKSPQKHTHTHNQSFNSSSISPSVMHRDYHYHYRYDCCSHCHNYFPNHSTKGHYDWIQFLCFRIQTTPVPGEQTPHTTTRNSQAKKKK